MKQRLRSLIARQAFFPTSLGLFVNPFYFARKGLAVAIQRHSTELSGKLLDVGCGSKPYEKLFQVDQYLGLDIDSAQSRARAFADYFYDGSVFPFGDASFDSVLCNQVLEHVFNPDQLLSEIYRVLKPNGALLLTVPFVWDEHEQPNDFARYSTFGLRHLLEKNEFAVKYQEKIGADVTIIFQLINAYLFKLSAQWSIYPRLAFTILVMGFINFIGLLASYIFPKNKDLFLDQIVVVKKAVS
jgi:SAM-dependent methyltransferase